MNVFLQRRLVLLTALIALLLHSACSCGVARADPLPPPDRNAQRAAALEAREARILIGTTGQPAPQECPSGFVAWDRGEYGSLCAQSCTSDFQCGSGERCTVLDPEPQLGAARVFADDVPDLFLNFTALAAAAATGPICDEPPECDAECLEPPPCFEINPVAPVALCDPLWDAG